MKRKLNKLILSFKFNKNSLFYFSAKKRNLNAFLTPSNPSTSSNPSQSTSPTGTIPKTSAYKRPNSSNIHRLHENSDDDEDKKTYNGNSTQQL